MTFGAVPRRSWATKARTFDSDDAHLSCGLRRRWELWGHNGASELGTVDGASTRRVDCDAYAEPERFSAGQP